MSKSTSERTPYSRHPRTASNPRASWTVASAAFVLAAFGCSSDPQKPPTPPKVDPAGIVVKLSLDSKFQPGVIEQIDVVLDAAAGGPSLKLSDAAGSALTFEGTNYRVEVRGVDTDEDAEVVATIEGNPFAQGATTVSVFIPTPQAIAGEGVPFQARLSAQGAMGTLSAASITTRTGGTLTFPKTGRYTVEATLACIANVSCKATTNRPPVMATFGNVPLVVRRWWPIELRPRAVDADGDKLTYSVAPEDLAALPGGTASYTAATNTFTWTPPPEAMNFMGRGANGMPTRIKPSWKVRFRVSDGHGGEAEQAVLIDVVQPNSNPVWAPVPPITVVEETEVVLNLSVKDPDGEALDFELDTVKLPPGANAYFDEDLGVFTWTPTYEDARARPYVARIYARDQNNGFALLEIPITVVDRNRPPVFVTSTETTFKAGVAGTFKVRAIDPDGDNVILGVDANALPAGARASLDVATGTFTWTPNAADARDTPYTLRLSARDVRGETINTSVAIRVTSNNSAPVFSALPTTLNVRENDTWTAAVAATDPDGDTVEVTADFAGLPTGHGATFASGTARWQPSPGMARSEPYRIAFVARDSKGATTRFETLFLVLRFVPGEPPPPLFTGSTPPSPANNNSPVLTGTTLARHVVTLYPNADCSGDYTTFEDADANGNFAIQIEVQDNSVTTWSATTTSLRERVSHCSVMPVRFTEDSQAPATPTITTVSPVSPANNNNPELTGTAEAGSTVLIYAAPIVMSTPPLGCSGTHAFMTVADAMGNFRRVAPVQDNTKTMFTVKAVDAASNASPCSMGTPYEEDSRVPAVPELQLATSPLSPSNVNTFTVLGNAEPDSLVTLYRDAACADAFPIEPQRAGVNTLFTFRITVEDNTTTRLFANTRTRVGNVSPCSTTSVTYVEDSLPPALPVILSTLPASPTNQAVSSVEVSGMVEAGAVVRLFGGSPCTGTPLGEPVTGANGAFTFSGVAFASNTTTQLFVSARDAAGNDSACSAPFPFVHDSVAPSPPTLQGTTPDSPSRVSTTPSVRGSAEAGATIKLFASADCMGMLAGTAIADSNQLFNAVVTVPPNASTSISANVTDGAGNISGCATPILYTHDNTPPDAPTALTTLPGSPSATELSPRVKGVVATGSVGIRLYVDAEGAMPCIGTPAATGTAALFASQGIILGVLPNKKTTLRATALDVAGNESSCSAPIEYEHDNVAPAAPTALSTLPVSPDRSSERFPHFKGQAVAGTTVSLYLTTNPALTEVTCTGQPVITGTAAEFASDGIIIPITANTIISVRASAKDAAGNESLCTAPIRYEHDSIAPTVAPTIVSTDPASPSNLTPSPRVKGSGAEANGTVTIFAKELPETGAPCSGTAVGSGPSSDFAVAGIVATLPPNKAHALRVITSDRAGNASPCSAPFVYRHDDLPPGPPTAVESTPASPSQEANPRLKATLEPGVVSVVIYRTFNCAEPPFTTVAASELTSGPGALVQAFDNQPTDYRFVTVDDAGNRGACSAPFVYVQDSRPPDAPVLGSTNPTPTGTTQSPLVRGQVEALSTLTFFALADCAGPSIGTRDAATFTGLVGVPVPVAPNVTTVLSAKATDRANNIGACSNNLSYTHDNIPPAAPSGITAGPASPPAVNAYAFRGTADAASTVRIFATATCTGTPLGTGTAEAFSVDGIAAVVPPALFNTLGFNTTDAAGNVSVACTALPAVPTFTVSVPTSPSRTVLDPLIQGGAGAGTTVLLFTTPDCSDASPSSGAVTGAQPAVFSIPVQVAANSTTSFRARARDAAGNTSFCSPAALTYVHDALSPTSVTVTPTTPRVPASDVFLNDELTCVAAGAEGDGVAYEYQWRRAAVDIVNATLARYIVTAVDRGAELKCFARARLGEQASAYLGSNGFTPVNRAPAAFTSTVTGTPAPGSTLTCTGDFASPDIDGEAVAFASALWEHTNNGTTWTPVAGATGEAIVLDNTDLNFSFRCTMTVRDAGLASTAGATSAAFGPILPPIQNGPVTCAKPPQWAYYREGLSVGSVFGVSCTTSDPQLVPYIASGTCPSLAFTGAALTGNLPAGGNGCFLTIGARTSSGVVCGGCQTDTVKLRVAKQVKDIVTCNTPENLGSEPASMLSYTEGSADKLFFSAFVDPVGLCDEGGTRPFKLFVSDGTPSGTHPIAHNDTLMGVPVTAQKLGASVYHKPMNEQGAVYVSVDDVILKSTGEGGELSVFATGVGFAKQLIFHDGFFFALTDTGLRKITTGGVVGSIVDAGPGVGPMVVFQNALYFGFRATPGQPLSKSESPYEESAPVGVATLVPDSLTVFNGKLYFSANGPTQDIRQLRSYDGTTFNVEFDIPAYGSSFHEVLGIAVRDNVMYFTSTTVEPPASDFYTSIYRLDTTGAPAKQIVKTITPNRVPKRVLLQGIDGVLGVVFSPNSEPLALQSYPVDAASADVAHYMTGPFYDRLTSNYTIGTDQVIAFPQLVSTSSDEELQHRTVLFKGEVYFAGQNNAGTAGFELWKLTDPKATDAPAP